MRKGIHPLAILLLAAVLAGAAVLGFFVKEQLREEWKQWEELIFWGIMILFGGAGALVIGKLFGRR